MNVTTSGEILVGRVTAKGLGDQLKAMRITAGLDRRQLAKQAGVAYETIWNVEKGRRLPSLAVLLLLLEVFDCHLQIRRPDILDEARQRAILYTQARVDAGLSRRQLADRMGCSVARVGRWERGEQPLQWWWESSWCAAVGRDKLPRSVEDLLT